MKSLTVAAILTCFNEGPYIGRAVRSVLEQTCGDAIKQIIIADDGSHQETIDVLKDIENWDPRISVIYGKGGARQAAQRNLAVGTTSSDCDCIAFLDGDDFWERTKIERQLKILSRDDDIGLVYSSFFTFPDGNEGAARTSRAFDLTNADDIALTYFLNDPPILPSTVVIRREIYINLGGMDPSISCFEETEFYLRLAEITRFQLIDEPLLYKRNHSFSVTTNRSDHMAYHALVAFKAAAKNPKLLPFVPKRLSERARKLGNHRFLLNDRNTARQFLWLALQLNPFNHRAWLTYMAARFFPNIALRMLGARGRERQASMGVTSGERH